MVDMGMAQKYIGRWGRRRAVAKLFTERDDAGAGVEDQPAPTGAYFDA
jgi:hypothetical protein